MKVVIVGAGIVGVSAALTLAEGGAEVVVLERGAVAGEASGLNAGVIGGGGWGHEPTIDVALRMGSRDRYLDLAQRRGRDIGLSLDGTLTLVRTEQEWEWAKASVGADAEAGRVTELLSTQELIELEPAVDPELLGAIFDPLGARAEPVASTNAFAAEAVAAGALITTGSTVHDLQPQSGGGWQVHAGPDAKVVGADIVLIAAGPWCADLGVMVGFDIPIVGVQGQMWATDPQPAMFRHAIAGAESFCAWAVEGQSELRPPYLTHRDGRSVTRHLYGAQRPNGEIIFGGDRVLTTTRAVDEDGIAVNHAHTAELLPQIAHLPPTRTWAGMMPFSLDGRPLLGPLPDRDGLFLAGGLASGGFGRGPMSGQLVAELVLGQDPGFDMTTVSPGRFAK